ncbi:unnamed protein product [Brassica oleracea]
MKRIYNQSETSPLQDVVMPLEQENADRYVKKNDEEQMEHWFGDRDSFSPSS